MIGQGWQDKVIFQLRLSSHSRTISIKRYNINTLHQNQKLYYLQKVMMRRFFIRPFHNFHDPFFSIPRILQPTYRIRIAPSQLQRPQFEVEEKSDPHALFDQFFKEHEIKGEQEKEFFKKLQTEAEEQKYSPYKVLEIQSGATLEDAKNAYRNMAIKYHPKNDSSPQAATKFADIAKAYETILQEEKSKQMGKLGFRSFFDEFEKQIEENFEPKSSEGLREGQKVKENSKEGSVQKGEQKQPNYGVLYSESSHYESKNGQQTKYVAEKLYKKDGKTLKVIREQRLKEDGKMEITESIDDGKEVKKKCFTQEKDQKQISE